MKRTYQPKNRQEKKEHGFKKCFKSKTCKRKKKTYSLNKKINE